MKPSPKHQMTDPIEDAMFNTKPGNLISTKEALIKIAFGVFLIGAFIAGAVILTGY